MKQLESFVSFYLFSFRITVVFSNLGSYRLSSILATVTSDFNTEFDLESLREFIEKFEDQLGAAEEGAKRAVDTVVANIEWMTNFYQIIIDWISVAVKL